MPSHVSSPVSTSEQSSLFVEASSAPPSSYWTEDVNRNSSGKSTHQTASVDTSEVSSPVEAFSSPPNPKPFMSASTLPSRLENGFATAPVAAASLPSSPDISTSENNPEPLQTAQSPAANMPIISSAYADANSRPDPSGQDNTQTMGTSDPRGPSMMVSTTTATSPPVASLEDSTSNTSQSPISHPPSSPSTVPQPSRSLRYRTTVDVSVMGLKALRSVAANIPVPFLGPCVACLYLILEQVANAQVNEELSFHLARRAVYVVQTISDSYDDTREANVMPLQDVLNKILAFIVKQRKRNFFKRIFAVMTIAGAIEDFEAELNDAQMLFQSKLLVRVNHHVDERGASLKRIQEMLCGPEMSTDTPPLPSPAEPADGSGETEGTGTVSLESEGTEAIEGPTDSQAQAQTISITRSST